jgi:hypothetical protein
LQTAGGPTLHIDIGHDVTTALEQLPRPSQRLWLSDELSVAQEVAQVLVGSGRPTPTRLHTPVPAQV